MKVLRGNEALRDARRAMVTIGSFDGLHLGHMAILAALKEAAGKAKVPSAVITFEPHPRAVLSKERSPFIITTLEEKTVLFGKMGIDYLVVLDFTADFASLDYEGFVNRYLVEILAVGGVIVGYNHHFGSGREGGYDALKKIGDAKGFDVIKVECFERGDAKVSSTTIRNFIAEGRMAEANRLLIEPYTIIAEVKGGIIDNIEPLKLLPPQGEYAATIDEKPYMVFISSERRITVAPVPKDGFIKIGG